MNPSAYTARDVRKLYYSLLNILGTIPRWIKFVLCGIEVLLLFIAYWSPISVQKLEPASIQPEQGHAFITAIHIRPSLFYSVQNDSPEHPLASGLVVLRDGKMLGPPHSLHDKIRAEGLGTFSHWGSSLYFSSPNNSDPRYDGSVYTIRAPLSLPPLIRSILFLLGAALGGVLVLLDLRVALASGVAVASLAATGAFKSTVASGISTDVPLVISAVWHSLLGAVIALLQWASGAGIITSFSLAKRMTPMKLALLGYLVSLPLLLIQAFLGLLIPPYGTFIALSISGVSCFFLLTSQQWKHEWRDLAVVLLPLIILAWLFGSWSGIVIHGPTSTLKGSIYGDMVFYAASSWSIESQPIPLRNLGVLAEPLSMFNLLWSTSSLLRANSCACWRSARV